MNQSLSASQDKSNEKPHGKRLISIDLLRGLVMVLMTLDHVRFFLSNPRLDPLDLSQTNLPLFLTRWVTHLCATSFIFLAGIAAYLSLRRGKTKPQLSRFLFTRGLWLVFLELTVVHFSWGFSLSYSSAFAGVLWAIGWSMVVLSALVYLPTPAIGAIGIVTIVTHNLYDKITAEQLGGWGWLWAILHEPKLLQILPGINLFTGYPLIPWIGVMAAGYAFGTVYELEKYERQQLLGRLGFGFILAFITLRAIDVYGDPDSWSLQSTIPFTVLSFLNCHKYPPSLLFLLMTLGPALLLLNLFENRIIARFLKPLILFGQVPLFFYVIHIPLIHAFAIVLAIHKYGLATLAKSFSRIPPNYGYDLPTIYQVWLVMLIILYPICYWFAKLKRKQKIWWLNYL